MRDKKKKISKWFKRNVDLITKSPMTLAIEDMKRKDKKLKKKLIEEQEKEKQWKIEHEDVEL